MRAPTSRHPQKKCVRWWCTTTWSFGDQYAIKRVCGRTGQGQLPNLGRDGACQRVSNRTTLRGKLKHTSVLCAKKRVDVNLHSAVCACSDLTDGSSGRVSLLTGDGELRAGGIAVAAVTHRAHALRLQRSSHMPSRVQDVHDADGARLHLAPVIALRPAFAARWCKAKRGTPERHCRTA